MRRALKMMQNLEAENNMPEIDLPFGLEKNTELFLPEFDRPRDLSDSGYNCVDILVTARAGVKLEAEGATRASLFDQALMGPSLLCGLRGMRIDHGKIAQAKLEIEERARAGKEKFLALAGSDVKFGKGFKPSPAELARILYRDFKVKTRLGHSDNPSVAQNILVDIRDDIKTPDAAVPIVELALELTALESDRQALEKPAGPDGRIHSSFMISAAVSARWGSRKDAFNEGMNLHGASDLIRKVFIPDPGKVLVALDQSQAESNLVAALSGSKWYLDAHKAGNVHVQSGKVFFPEYADIITKDWAKNTPFPSSPGKMYYDLMKSCQHALNYGQSVPGMSKHLHILKTEAQQLSLNYFKKVPEIPRYHEWIASEIRTKRRLVTPFGRVRQFLGRTWEHSSVREAISYQPQSTVSDITKIFLWRLFTHLDPDSLQILMEHHDSVMFQVDEDKLDTVMPLVHELSYIPFKVGSEIIASKWEAKVGYSWSEI